METYWSKPCGRGGAYMGSTVQLIPHGMVYSDAMGNVLNKLIEKEHEVLFSHQERYNAYIRRATKNAYLNIQQASSQEEECPLDEMGQTPEPYLEMVSAHWLHEAPLAKRDKEMVTLYLQGYTMAEIGESHGLTESAISYRLRKIAGKLRNFVPELRPGHSGLWQEINSLKHSKRHKEEYVAWINGHGKTHKQYANMTAGAPYCPVNPSCPVYFFEGSSIQIPAFHESTLRKERRF